MKHQRRRTKKNEITSMTIIIGILAVILIGDLVGAVMYVRQSPSVQAELMDYLATGDSLSFLQIFWQQFLYQFTIWTMGLTVIGNLVNIFLIFVRGVSAGFNIAVLVQEASFGVLVLWLIQYLLIIATTVLSAYFSIRFAYLVVKSVMLKKYDLLKRHFKNYARQFVVIMVLTMVTSLFTAVITPIVQNQFSISEVVAEI